MCSQLIMGGGPDPAAGAVAGGDACACSGDGHDDGCDEWRRDVRHILRLCDPSVTEGELLPRPTLIGVTGNAPSEDLDRFMASGAVCVLTKPLSGAKIVHEVKARMLANLAERRLTETAEAAGTLKAGSQRFVLGV